MPTTTATAAIVPAATDVVTEQGLRRLAAAVLDLGSTIQPEPGYLRPPSPLTARGWEIGARFLGLDLQY